MKIVRYEYETKVSYGIVLNNRILDRKELSNIIRDDLPETVEELIENNLVDLLIEKISALKERKWEGIPLSRVKLLAPIEKPPKIICLGRNYIEHAKEEGREAPREPVIFMKPRTAIAGPYEEIEIPYDYAKLIDYEGELAFIIGKKGKRISRERAYDYVLGYIVFNDVSARDLQYRDGQWTRGKSLDKFAPIGPWIVTKDEIPNPHGLRIVTKVNNEIRQNSTTAKMVFKIPDILYILSKGITFEPGDIIATGTPAGVGYFWKPEPKLIKHGDVVEITIEKIGTIRNRFVFV